MRAWSATLFIISCGLTVLIRRSWAASVVAAGEEAGACRAANAANSQRDGRHFKALLQTRTTDTERFIAAARTREESTDRVVTASVFASGHFRERARLALAERRWDSYSGLVWAGVALMVLTSVVAVFLCIIALRRPEWADFGVAARGRLGFLLQRSEKEEEELRQNEEFSEDTYGNAVVSLVRDTQMIVNGSGTVPLRGMRIVLSFGLLFANVAVQTYLMMQIRQFCTAKWVHDIRQDYNDYELHMYEGELPGHTTLTVNGNHRGKDAYFRPEKFASLEAGLKERVCNIPFSQPGFFMMVLFIWTLTCLAELKQCVGQFLSLIVLMPVLTSMAEALQGTGANGLEHDADGDGVAEKLVNGLTWVVKATILFLVLLPRFVITCALLWLGCRWLAATNDFSDLVLNAVALEFLLMLKELLYHTLVPARNKRDLRNTFIRPPTRLEPAGYWAFLNTFSLALVAMGWVLYYFYRFQTVLPEYRWDVHASCDEWFREKYRV